MTLWTLPSRPTRIVFLCASPISCGESRSVFTVKSLYRQATHRQFLLLNLTTAPTRLPFVLTHTVRLDSINHTAIVFIAFAVFRSPHASSDCGPQADDGYLASERRFANSPKKSRRSTQWKLPSTTATERLRVARSASSTPPYRSLTLRRTSTNKPSSWRASTSTSFPLSVRFSAQRRGSTEATTRSLHNWAYPYSDTITTVIHTTELYLFLPVVRGVEFWLPDHTFQRLSVGEHPTRSLSSS